MWLRGGLPWSCYRDSNPGPPPYQGRALLLTRDLPYPMNTLFNHNILGFYSYLFHYSTILIYLQTLFKHFHLQMYAIFTIRKFSPSSLNLGRA